MTEAANRRRSTDDRRAEIAAAARQLIAEKGFEGLRTRDIAERVGINVATLHYHVPSKDALIEMVAESLRDDFIAQDLAVPRDRMSPAQRLRQEIEDFLDLNENRRDMLFVLSEFVDRAKHDPQIAATFGKMQTHWVSEIRQILIDGLATGDFRSNLDPETAAPLFTSAMIGCAKMKSVLNTNLRPLLDELERSFLSTSQNG